MSQETERYQLENNGNTYLVRTPAGSGGGADVEANPEGTATEDLEKLQVGETIYGLPPVVGANPVLAGTEPNLTGLQIGDTKYAVESGMTNPMTTAGDIIYAGANGTPTRLALSQNTHAVLKSSWGTSQPVWDRVGIGDINVQAGNQYKVPFATSNGQAYNLAMGKPASDFGLGFITTAPTADNTDGGIRIVVLSSEPATRYNGYLYIITA